MDINELRDLDQSKILYKGDWQIFISKEFVFNTNLSKDARFLFVILKSFTNPTNPVAFPGTKYLQNIMGIKTYSTLGGYMDELVNFGFIRKTQIKEKGKFARNIYELHEKPEKQPNLPMTDFSISENLEDLPMLKNSDTEKSTTNNNNNTNKDNIGETEQVSLLDEYISTDDIEDDIVLLLVRDWNIIAIANGLQTVEQVNKIRFEAIHRFNEIHTMDEVKEEVARSKYLRGLGKGNKRENALKFDDLFNPRKAEFQERIFTGYYRDDTIRGNHLFSESPYFKDFDKFEKALKKHPLFPDFQNADIKHYWKAVMLWSQKQGVKRTDWIAEALNFMQKDTDGGTLIKAGSTKTQSGDNLTLDDSENYGA